MFKQDLQHATIHYCAFGLVTIPVIAGKKPQRKLGSDSINKSNVTLTSLLLKKEYVILGVSHCWIQCICWQVFQWQRPGQMNCKIHTELIPRWGLSQIMSYDTDIIIWCVTLHFPFTVHHSVLSFQQNVDLVDKLVRHNCPPAAMWNKTLQFTFRFEHSYCSVVLLIGSLTGWDFKN